MVTNVYGHGRRLRVAKWTAAFLIAQGIQDTRIKDMWCREGMPGDARLVDVSMEPCPQVKAATNFCIIVEHATFDPVPRGHEIPAQPVVYLDLKRAMDWFVDSTTDS
jgi:hypothetical protein